MSVEQQ